METIIALIALHTIEGAGTIYLGEIGDPLVCDRPDFPLVYSENTDPWVAFPKAKFDSGEVRCGDLVHVLEYLPDGTTRSFMARVYDSGSFGEHTAIGGLSIVVDVAPWVATWPLYPGWARVRVTNLSAVVRGCRERGICD